MPKRARLMLIANSKVKKLKMTKEELSEENKVKEKHWDTQYIERILTKDPMQVHIQVYHDIIPAFNAGLVPENNLDLWLPYPTYKFSTPCPIYMASCHASPIDICSKRPMDYLNYRARLQCSRSAFYNAKKIKQKRSVEKENIYHLSVFEIAERVQQRRDIDPFFHASYDYYYTGGNLCVLPQFDKVLHVGNDNLRELYVSQFSKSNTLVNGFGYLENSCVKLLNNSSEIFEVQNLCKVDSIYEDDAANDGVGNCNNQNNYFLTRQRNVIMLYRYDDANGRLHKMMQFKSQKSPFISMAASQTTCGNGIPNELLISSMKQQVRQYDLNTQAPTLINRFELSKEYSWNIVRPWREHMYLYANERQFNLIDIRTTPDQWLDKINLNQTNSYTCEHISTLMRSNYTNLFYMATSHRLYCVDVRYIKATGNSEFGIYRWTHQCEYPPLMIDTLRIQNKREYIALSSPLSGDICVCELSRTRNNDKEQNISGKFLYKSKQLPYQLPTLQEAYDYARLKGKCLQPEANLQQRIRCCTTGLKFYKRRIGLDGENESLHLPLLLFSNSIGDVYVYSITKGDTEDEMRIQLGTSAVMDDYAKKVKDIKTPPLNYTIIVDFKVMRKIFRCSRLSKKSDELDLENMSESYNESETEQAPLMADGRPMLRRKRRFQQRLGRWQKSLTTLRSYKDALVQDLLAAWDIDTNKTDLSTTKVALLNGTDTSSGNKIEMKINDWFNRQELDSVTNLDETTTPINSIAAPNNHLSDTCINNLSQQMDSYDVMHSTQIVPTTELNNDCTVNRMVDDSALDISVLSGKIKNRKKKLRPYIGF